LFNAVIDGLNLKQLQMSDRMYTWANNLTTPTFEKTGSDSNYYGMGREVPFIYGACLD
jgi:hypothetical protein